MELRYHLRRTRLFVLGAEWWLPLLGALTTAGIFVGGALEGSLQLRTVALVASVAGGLVTGIAHGRNWLGAALVAFRAVVVAFFLVAAATAVGLFLAWRSTTGESFYFLAPFVGSLLLFLLPIYGFAGAIAGAVGSTARRWVVPSEYNPPAY